MQQNGGEWIWWKTPPPTSKEFLNSLLKTHGARLTDESLQTLLTEVEAIVNSCPLTTDVIKMLEVLSGVVIPLPGVFTSGDMYCRKHWRRVNTYPANSGVGGEKRYY